MGSEQQAAWAPEADEFDGWIERTHASWARHIAVNDPTGLQIVCAMALVVRPKGEVGSRTSDRSWWAANRLTRLCPGGAMEADFAVHTGEAGSWQSSRRLEVERIADVRGLSLACRSETLCAGSRAQADTGEYSMAECLEDLSPPVQYRQRLSTREEGYAADSRERSGTCVPLVSRCTWLDLAREVDYTMSDPRVGYPQARLLGSGAWSPTEQH